MKGKKSAAKRRNTDKSQKRKSIDVERIEGLVTACLESEFGFTWYLPDNCDSIAHFDEIVEAFAGGFDVALTAVLEALRGDDGEALEAILNRNVIVTRPEDTAERDAKLERGVPIAGFRLREEAEAFLSALGLDQEFEEIPPEWLN